MARVKCKKSPDVQIEHGYWRLANSLSDALVQHKFTGRELTLLIAIMRNTYGYNKKKRMLSHTYLANATGISRQNVVAVIQKLKRCDVLHVDGVTIGINKQFDAWEVPRRRLAHVSKGSLIDETKSTSVGSLVEGTGERLVDETGGSLVEGTGGSLVEGTKVVSSTRPNKDNLKNNKQKTKIKKQEVAPITCLPLSDAEEKATKMRIDILDIDRTFSQQYLRTSGQSLDVVVTERSRHEVWKEILSQYSWDVVQRALPEFFATDDPWFSGQDGRVNLPFTPALFRTWLKQQRHTRGGNTVVTRPVQTVEEARAARANAIAICKREGLTFEGE